VLELIQLLLDLEVQELRLVILMVDQEIHLLLFQSLLVEVVVEEQHNITQPGQLLPMDLVEVELV